MPAPQDLLKSLTGHPTAVDQSLGCMTGLFHIFEGHPAFMGRRYSSTRVGIDSGQSQLRTQTYSQSHRHGHRNNPFSKVEDTHKKTVQSTKQHQRSHSDVSDLATTPSRTLTEFRTSKDGNDKIEPTPACSEGTVDALAFYNNESLRAAAIFAGDPRRRSDLDQREYSKRSVVSPKTIPKPRLVDNDTSSSDIRNALLASFQREIERPKSTKANSDQSVNSSRNQGSLKNRRDGCQKDRKGAVSRKEEDLPRSSSVYARYEPSELVHWKDGLRSSASPPRKLSHHNSPERRVEPKKDRGRSLSRDHYPFASMSPKRFPGSQGPNPRDRGHGEILNQDCNFKESPGASDFRESLRPFLTGAQERHNVPPRESFASRSADSSGFTSESNLAGVSQQMCKHLPDSEAESNEHSVVPNVIARLMGLEEIPSSNQQGISSLKVPDAKSRGDKFFRGLVQFDPQITRSTSPPPPPPCQSKKYVVHHHERPSAYYRKEYGLQGAYQVNYPAQYKLEQGLCSCEEDRDYEHLSSRPFLPFEDEPQEGAHPAAWQLAESGKLADATTEAEDINIVAPEKKKKMLRKILEAMRPKVLLKISRRKQTEQEKSPMTKLITTDVQPVEELLKKQQPSTLIKVVTGLKLPSGTDKEESPRYTSDTSSVNQVREQQTDSSNSTDSSVVKPCTLQPDENTIVVMKPNTRSQDSNAGIFQVRHVETASSTSNDKEMYPTRRTAQINNEDWNLAKDQRRAMKPVESRVATDNAPRSAQAESTLESDYETDPSSTAQNDKSNNVRESRKIRTTTRKRNPSSKSPIPDTQRKHGLCSSPEARPSLSRCSPSKDHIRGTGELGSKSVVAKSKTGSKATPANPKAQLTKEETLKRRVTKNPDDSRLRGGSLENEPTLTNIEKPVAKETFPVRSAGARARSPAAPTKLDVSRSSTTDAATLDTSDGSNWALLQPASAQPQTSDSKPVLEQFVAVQPKPGRFKEPHVYIRRTPPEVQRTEGDSVGDHHGDASEPERFEACSAIPDEAQPLLQVQEPAIEASEELTTPRGIPLQCVKLDGKLAEGLDRPSPISVLDTATFDEELTPSPSSLRHSVPVLQDSVTTCNDEGYERCAKDLEAYHETPSAVIEDDLNFDEFFSKCAEGLRAKVESTETEIRLNRFRSYFKDAEPDEERTFVESFLLAPEVATSCKSHDSSAINSRVSDKFKTKRSGFELTDTENINENLLQSLQSNGILQENDHILLLDCLEEIMEKILDSQSNLMLWAGLPPETICEKSKGKQLEQELWIELRDIKRTPPSEDICDTVHRLLQKDLIKCQGRQWSNFNTDREKISVEMETMIVGDLIEEAVRDLCALQWHKPSLPIEATRRQLFTN